MSPNYIYTPLGEHQIRLFDLLPAISYDAPLECMVGIHDRDHSLAYEAVSYVWGPDDVDFTQLKVRQTSGSRFSGNRHFWIQPSLATALRRFRFVSEPRTLWSDAICINQSSTAEKSQQVPMMEKTYSQAARVLVWLGEATDKSPTAIRFMRQMLEPHTNFDDLAKSYADEWAALENLMRRSWFTRRWIVQEIALAKDATLYCGLDEISWSEFCDVVTLFQEHYADIKPSFLSKAYHFSRNRLGEITALGACRLVYVTTNLFQKSEKGTIQRRLVTLESLVCNLNTFRASNVHDIIYSLIPIAKDIKTASQDKFTIAPDALEVQTPPLPETDAGRVEVPPSKKQKTTQYGTASQRVRDAARAVMAQQEPSSVPNGRDKGALKRPMRFEGVVDEIVGKQPARFVVDYEHSFLRVCMIFVSYAIMQSNALDIICRPWVPEELKEEYDLPSWLMDADCCSFRPQAEGTFVRVNADPLVGQDAMQSSWYKACGDLARPIKLDPKTPENGWGFGFFDRSSRFEDADGSHKSLFVLGFVLDTIEEIKDKAEDGTIPSDWFTFADWRDRRQLAPDPFWRTLVANRDSHGRNVFSHYQRTLRDIMQHHGARGSALNINKTLATPQNDKRSERVLDRMLATVPGRRLFKTTSRTERTLGLAPGKARQGDLVCILFGCSVPVVLRKHLADLEDGPCVYYELLGDAYVHGMMEGAALEEADRLDIPTQQFELR